MSGKLRLEWRVWILRNQGVPERRHEMKERKNAHCDEYTQAGLWSCGSESQDIQTWSF